MPTDVENVVIASIVNNKTENIVTNNKTVDITEHVNKETTIDKVNSSINNGDKISDSTSYANFVKNNEFPKELMFIPTVLSETGNEVVVFDELLVKNGSERWLLTPCGQFICYNMSIHELRYNIRRMWNKFGIDDISASKMGSIYLSLVMRKV